MVPSDEQLTDLIASHPGLGLQKLLAAARAQGWQVSEKRLRKAVPKNLVPKTGLDRTVDVVDKVTVQLVPGRGKGLYAAQDLLEGEVLWQEEPWIATADS